MPVCKAALVRGDDFYRLQFGLLSRRGAGQPSTALLQCRWCSLSWWPLSAWPHAAFPTAGPGSFFFSDSCWVLDAVPHKPILWASPLGADPSHAMKACLHPKKMQKIQKSVFRMKLSALILWKKENEADRELSQQLPVWMFCFTMNQVSQCPSIACAAPTALIQHGGTEAVPGGGD